MTRPRAHLLSTYAAAVVLAVGTCGLLAAGCKPDYPSCETDKDCHEKEFCVARKCQQCRDSADCPVGSSCKSVSRAKPSISPTRLCCDMGEELGSLEGDRF